MKELIITANDADQRLDKFLLKSMEKLPKSLLYKSIRNKKIKVNRKRCEAAQRLQIGDVVQLFLPPDVLEETKNYDFLNAQPLDDKQIVYEDSHIIVLNKASGVLCHSESKADEDTLIQRLWRYLYEKKVYDPQAEQSFRPALANRIDRNTQGIVLAAKDAASLRALNEIIRRHRLRKFYHCIIEGRMKPEDTLVLYHQKQKEINKATLSAEAVEGAKMTRTSYRELQSNGRYSLLEVELHSGRSHQIRAAFAYYQHPLLGDVKYGAKKHRYPYQALCSYQITFLSLHDDPLFAPLAYLSDQTITLPHCEIDDLYDRLSS